MDFSAFRNSILDINFGWQNISILIKTLPCAFLGHVEDFMPVCVFMHNCCSLQTQNGPRVIFRQDEQMAGNKKTWHAVLAFRKSGRLSQGLILRECPVVKENNKTWTLSWWNLRLVYLLVIVVILNIEYLGDGRLFAPEKDRPCFLDP